MNCHDLKEQDRDSVVEEDTLEEDHRDTEYGEKEENLTSVNELVNEM